MPSRPLVVHAGTALVLLYSCILSLMVLKMLYLSRMSIKGYNKTVVVVIRCFYFEETNVLISQKKIQ